MSSFRAIAGFSVRRPRLVLALALAALGVSGAIGALRLEVRTSNLDLVDPALPEVRAFLEFAREFGTPNVLVVALEGEDPRSLHEAVDRVGPRLAEGPGVARVLDRLPFDDRTLETLGLERYLETADGRMAFLFVQPDDPYSSASTIEPFVAGVRERLDRADLAALGVRTGLTGMPAYALDDRNVVRREVSTLSLASLVLVVLLFRAGFGAFRHPLLAALALLVGAGWTIGPIAFVPGHLTLLSSFFAAILFGLGIDFGIHLVNRVEELAGRGFEGPHAVVEAAAGAGRGLATAMATTALVFAALVFCGFRGFAELGTIAAIGIVLCLASAITVLPALLVSFPRRGVPAPASRRIGRLLVVAQRGRLAFGLGALSLLGLFFAPGFDPDYLDLQPAGSDAVRIEREMIRRSDLSPAFAAFVVESRDDAARLTDRLLDEPTVAQVRSILDLDDAAATALEPVAIPAALRDAFESPRGRLAVYAYPAGDVWDGGFQEAFVAAMRALDPRVTGMPILGRFLFDRSRRAMARAALLGALVLAACLLVDFRRPLPAALAALPTALTVCATPGLMRLCGLSFNPLNVMALPVVLGVAVDDGIHIVHRFLEERGDLRRTLDGTGRSVVLTTATTLAAFATLGFATHRGLASFAWTLSIGVTVALLLSVLVLPAALVALRSRLLRPARSRLAPRRMVAGGLSIAILAGCIAPTAASAERSAAERRGDAAWAARAGSFATTGTVEPGPALEAVAAYEEALESDPDDLALHFKSVEALYFAAHFAVGDGRRGRELVDRMLERAEGAWIGVAGRAGGEDRLHGLDPAARAALLADVPGAREACFWTAIAWGVWAMSHGNVAAARRGAAGRIRDRAETLIALDERFASAGGLRLLGRLHAATPRVPFFTGWIDRRAGLRLLRRALAISDEDPRNALFLAEALLEHEPGRRDEALALLREVAGRSPDPQELVEQTEILEQAREALARAER